MRWNDIKINESKQTETVKIKSAEHHLDALVAGAQSLPDDDPIKGQIVKKLSSMNNAIQNFIAKVKGEISQQPDPAVNEDVSNLNDALSQQKDNLYTTIASLDELYEHMPTPEGQAALEQKIADIDVQLYDVFLIISKERKELKSALATAKGKAKEVEDFFRGLLPLLRQLGNKVNDYTELTDDDLAAMAATDRAQSKKKAVNAGKFAQTLAEAMSGKVLKLLSEGKTTTKEIKNFLQACLDGRVINLLNMVKTNQGLIDNYVNDEYKNDYENFVKENIFSYSPGATSGAIGPGELALAMLGDPANKATSGGDLYIGDTLYEIKAGKGTSGGRMNSKQIVSATAGMPVWEKGINQILRDAKAEGKIEISDKKGKSQKIPLKLYTGTTHNKTGKGYKPGSRYNFNPSGIKGLNDDILIPYAEEAGKNTKKTAKDVTYQLFHDAFKALVGNWDQIPNADKAIYNAVNDDGTVEYANMAKAYTSIAYKSYQAADEVEQILFIRTDTRHFSIIEGHDDFMSAIEFGKDANGKDVQTGRVQIGSGFTWNDDQQTPTPTYLSAKHS